MRQGSTGGVYQTSDESDNKPNNYDNHETHIENHNETAKFVSETKIHNYPSHEELNDNIMKEIIMHIKEN